MNTPWGETQSIEILSPHVQWVSTASHGGVVLSEEVQDIIPRSIVGFTCDRRFWEEDCDWAVPFLCLPNHFKEWSLVQKYGMATTRDIAIKSISYRQDWLDELVRHDFITALKVKEALKT